MALINRLIRQLIERHASGIQLRAADWTDAVQDEADAYAVQYHVAAGVGWSARHWKVGGASPQGPFSHSPVMATVGRGLLGIEAEVALRLRHDMKAADIQDGWKPQEWIDAMCISVECIGSRWEEGLTAPELLRMADFQSNAGLLVGGWQPFRRLDWGQLGWRLEMPGQDDIIRRGGHSLADPAGVLPAWLRHFDKTTIAAGTVVTTGAWGGLHPLTDAARAGKAIKLSFDELGDFNFSLPT